MIRSFENWPCYIRSAHPISLVQKRIFSKFSFIISSKLRMLKEEKKKNNFKALREVVGETWSFWG